MLLASKTRLVPFLLFLTSTSFAIRERKNQPRSQGLFLGLAQAREKALGTRLRENYTPYLKNILVVIKDYECVRRRIVTLIDTLNDFPIWLLTSVYCKINIFPSTTGVYIKIFQWQSPWHSDRIEQVPVQTALRDGANFRRQVSWKD